MERFSETKTLEAPVGNHDDIRRVLKRRPLKSRVKRTVGSDLGGCRTLASDAIGKRGDAGAPFAARNETGLFKSARLEASADLLGLASEDARKNKVTTGE